MSTLEEINAELDRRKKRPATVREASVIQNPLPASQPVDGPTLEEVDAELKARQRGIFGDVRTGISLGTRELAKRGFQGLQAAGVKMQDDRPDKLTVEDPLSLPMQGIRSKTDDITEAVKRGVHQTYVKPAGKVIETIGRAGEATAQQSIEANPQLQLPARLANRPVLASMTDDTLSFYDKARVFVHGTSRQLPQVGLSAGISLAAAATGNAPLAIGAATLGLGTNFLAETGDVYDAILQDNPGVDKRDAAGTALIHGTVASALETLPVGNAIRLVKGGKKALLDATLKELLSKPKLAGTLAAAIATQGLSEGVQEALQELSNNIAQRVYNENHEVFANVGESAFMGAVIGILTGAIGGGVAHYKAKKRYDNLGLKEIAEDFPEGTPPDQTPQQYKAKLILEHKEKLRKANLSDEQLDELIATPTVLAEYGLYPSDIMSIKVERNLDKDLADRTRQAIEAAPNEATKLGILSTLQGHMMQKIEETEKLNLEEAEAKAAEEEKKKVKAKERREAKAKGEPTTAQRIRTLQKSIYDFKEQLRYADRKDRGKIQKRLDETVKELKSLTTEKNKPKVERRKVSAEKRAKFQQKMEAQIAKLNEEYDKAHPEIKTTPDEELQSMHDLGRHIILAETNFGEEGKNRFNDIYTKEGSLSPKETYDKVAAEFEKPEVKGTISAQTTGFNKEQTEKSAKAYFKSIADNKSFQLPEKEYVSSFTSGAEIAEGVVKKHMPTIPEGEEITKEHTAKIDSMYNRYIKDMLINKYPDDKAAWRTGWIQEEAKQLKRPEMFMQGQLAYVMRHRKNFTDAANEIATQFGKDSEELAEFNDGYSYEMERTEGEATKDVEDIEQEDLTIKGIDKTQEELAEMEDQDYWDLTDAASIWDEDNELVTSNFIIPKQRFTEYYKKGITDARKVLKTAGPSAKGDARNELYALKFKNYSHVNGPDATEAWRIGWIKAEALVDKRSEMFVKGQIDYIKETSFNRPRKADRPALQAIAEEYGVASQELKDYNEGYNYEYERTDGLEDAIGDAVKKAVSEEPEKKKPKFPKGTPVTEEQKEKTEKARKTRTAKKSVKKVATPGQKIRTANRMIHDLKQSIKRYKGELTPRRQQNLRDKKANLAFWERKLKEAIEEEQLNLPSIETKTEEIEKVVKATNAVKSKKTNKAAKKEADDLKERKAALEQYLRQLYADGFVEIPELMGGLDLITNEQLEAVEALIARIEEERDKTTNLLPAKKSKVSADLRAVVKLLGANMYRANLVEASIKELVQNSFDAVKGSKKKDGRIDITVNSHKRLVMVRDNGIGMTKKTIEDAFLKIAGTEKPGLKAGDASGGLGMAKMLVFSQDKVWLHTIKGGKKSVIEATDQELFDGIHIDPKTTKEQAGTTIVLQVPERVVVDGKEYEIHFPYYSPSFLDRPLIDPRIEFRYLSDPRSGRDVADYLNPDSNFWQEYDNRAEVIKVGKHMDLSNYLPPKKVTFEWGEADVYISDERVDWPDHYVLSAGVYQFEPHITHVSDKMVKHDVIINLKPKVKAQHHLYPFNLKREGWKDTKTIQEDKKAIYHYISMLALGAEADEVVETFKVIKAMPKVDTGSTKGTVDIKDFILDKPKKADKSARDSISDQVYVRKDGKLYTKDKRGRYQILWEPAREKEESDIGSGKTSFKAKEQIKAAKDYLLDVGIDDSQPIFHNNTSGDFERGGELFAELGSIFLDAKDKFFELYPERRDPDRSYFAGISIDKGYKGINIQVPFAASFLNPLDVWTRNLPSITLELYEAMIHELAHNLAGEHNEHYASAYHMLSAKFAADGFDIDARVKIARTLRKHQQLFNDLRSEYERASTKNIAKSLQGGKENSYLAALARRGGSVTKRGPANKITDTEGPLEARRESRGGKRLQRNAAGVKRLGLAAHTVSQEILKQLKLKKMPYAVKVWSLYAQLPEEVKRGLKSGKAEEIVFTPPTWQSTLIEKYIMKAAKSQSADKWLKQIEQWTQKKERVKYDKETGEVKITVQDPRVGEPVVEDIEFSGLIEWLQENEDVSIKRDDIVKFLQANSLIGALKERTQGLVSNPMILQAVQDYTRYFQEDFKAIEDKYDIAFMQANRDGIIMNLLDLEAEPELNRLSEVIRRDTNARGSGPVDWDLLDMAGEPIPPTVREVWEEHVKKNYPELYTNPKEEWNKLIAKYYSNPEEIKQWFDDYIQDELVDALEDTYTEFGVEMQALDSRGVNPQASGPKLGGPYKHYRNHLIDYTGRRGIVINVIHKAVDSIISANHRNLESATNAMRALERKHPNYKGQLQLESIIGPDVNELIDYSHFTKRGHANLIHIRASVRTTKSGENILFIEEIQSDWHQWAKRKGGIRTKPLNTLKENLKIARKTFDKIFKDEFGGKYDVAMTNKVWEALQETSGQYNPIIKERFINPGNTALNAFFAGFDKVFERQVVRAFDAEVNKLLRSKENPNLPAKGKNIDRRIENFRKHKMDVLKRFSLADRLAREVFPTVVEYDLQKNMQPMAPLKTGWESLSIKRMVQQAISEGINVVAWAKTEAQVKDIQGWSYYGETPDKVKGIIDRYVNGMGNTTRKIFKKYGIEIEDFQIPTGHSSDISVDEDWETVHGFRINEPLKAAAISGLPLPAERQRRVQGVYYNGQMHFIAENIDSVEEIKGLLIHEGGHFLRRNDPIFRDKYAGILEHFKAMRSTNEAVLDAYEESYRDWHSPEVWDEEALLYYLQDEANRKGTLWERLVDLFKRWMYKFFARTPKQLNLSGRAMAQIVLNDLRAGIDNAIIEETIEVGKVLASEKTNPDAKAVEKAVEENMKKSQKLLKKHLGTPETYKESLKRLEFEQLSPAAKQVIALTDSIIKQDLKGFTRDKDTQTTHLGTRLFSSPEYYFMRDSTAAKIFNLAQDKGTTRYTVEHQILGDFIDIVHGVKKNNPKAYDKAAKYLVKADQTGKGFSIKWNTDDSEWMILDIHNKPIKRFKDEQMAVRFMVHAEQQWLKQKWFNPDARKMIKAARELTNRGFDINIADFRRQIQNALDNEQPVPSLSLVNDDGTRQEVTLEEAITFMGDLRGTYFPRERPTGTYILKAVKNGAPGILLTFDGYLPANDKDGPITGKAKKIINSIMPISRKASELKKLGYTIKSVDKTKTASNVIFDVPGLLTSMQALLDASDKTLSAKEMHKADKVLLGEVSRQLSLRIADVYKAKGTFSSRLKRSKVLWEGYEEDPIKALTGYAQRVAVGHATRTTARKMLLTMTGRDVTWPQFRKANPGATYTEYRKEVKRKAINATTQAKLYEDMRLYIQQVLKPDDSIDRAIGYGKAAAVFKFLGFRVASPVINQTNMALAVPATLAAHADISLTKSWKYTVSAAHKYTLYRLERIKKLGYLTKEAENWINKFKTKEVLTAKDRRVFDKISELGWDEAQFNHEAARVIASKLNKGINMGMQAAMYMFGATEKANRAMTIFAAFNALKDGTARNAKNGVVLKAAKHVSDRAHGVYGSMAKPWLIQKWRPADLLYTFMKFQHNYLLNSLELGMKYKNWKASAYMLLAPAVMSGLEASIVLKALFWLWGAAFDVEEPEEQLYQTIDDEFGFGGFTSRFVRHGGVGAFAHINLRGSLQMNQPFPTKISEIGGAPGSIVGEILAGAEHISQNEYWKALEDLSPTAIGSASKGLREYKQGVTTATNAPVFYGGEQLKSDWADSAIRFFSFNPSFISAAREKQWREDELRRTYTAYRSDIKAQLIHYLQTGSTDQEWWAEIQKMIYDYNEKAFSADPKYRIPIVDTKWLDAQVKSSFTPDIYERHRRN